jgi:hypothetical protein
MIRRRGNSLQVIVYAGVDPATGRKLYLRESATDEKEADRALTRLCAQVDEQRYAKTNATFQAAIEKWLRINEIDPSTPRQLRDVRATAPLPGVRQGVRGPDQP